MQATNALYETFRKQQPPSVGSMQSASYHRLKQLVRMLRVEASLFAKSLEDGEGREQTVWIYETLMSRARSSIRCRSSCRWPTAIKSPRISPT